MVRRPRDGRPRSAPPMTQTDPMPEYDRLRAVLEATSEAARRAAQREWWWPPEAQTD